ncbi:MAG: beta-lactamase family protein [Bacteroidales bacterium]|nr:beta-lactamase family protein [Bacteroidales bacterium]
MIRRLLLSTIAILLFTVTPSGGRGFDKVEFEEDFIGVLKDMEAVGAAAIVLRGGQEAYSGAFGERVRTLSGRLPYSKDILIRVGEVSCPVISIAVMQLVEEGKLSLNTDVSEYLGYKVRNPKKPSKAVTLKMLLTGATSKFLEPSEAYIIAATLVEKVTGMPFDSYARASIFNPLGIEAHYDASAVPEEKRADSYNWSLERRGYSENTRTWLPLDLAGYAPGESTSNLHPQSGLIISTEGLAKLIVAVMDYGLCPSGKRIYSEATGKELLRQQGFRKRQSLGFAYNTSVPDYVFATALGNYRGMSVCVYFNAKDRVALIASCNGSHDRQPDSDGVIGNHFNREMRKLFTKHLID